MIDCIRLNKSVVRDHEHTMKLLLQNVFGCGQCIRKHFYIRLKTYQSKRA